MGFSGCVVVRGGMVAVNGGVCRVGVVVFFVSYKVYTAVGSLVPWSLENSTLNFVLAVIGVDFLFYWFHRMGHTINILWASHMPHHSSEELNYTVALRSSITQRMTGILFYWPLALFGFSAELIIAAIALNLVMQFWQHTRSIRRLPRWFEAVFNSPTHHQSIMRLIQSIWIKISLES